MNEVMKRHVEQAVRTINYDFEIKNDITGFVPYGVKEGCMMSDSYGTVFFTAMKK